MRAKYCRWARAWSGEGAGQKQRGRVRRYWHIVNASADGSETPSIDAVKGAAGPLTAPRTRMTGKCFIALQRHRPKRPG